MKESNKYLELIKARNKASDDLYEWEKQCVEVNLTLVNNWFGKLHPYDFHSWFEQNFPELISMRRISDGCQEKLELTAPKDDIIAALQLCLDSYSPIKTTPLIYKCIEKIILNLDNCKICSLEEWLEEIEKELNFKESA